MDPAGSLIQSHSTLSRLTTSREARAPSARGSRHHWVHLLTTNESVCIGTRLQRGRWPRRKRGASRVGSPRSGELLAGRRCAAKAAAVPGDSVISQDHTRLGAVAPSSGLTGGVARLAAPVAALATPTQQPYLSRPTPGCGPRPAAWRIRRRVLGRRSARRATPRRPAPRLPLVCPRQPLLDSMVLMRSAMSRRTRFLTYRSSWSQIASDSGGSWPWLGFV